MYYTSYIKQYEQNADEPHPNNKKYLLKVNIHEFFHIILKQEKTLAINMTYLFHQQETPTESKYNMPTHFYMLKIRRGES